MANKAAKQLARSNASALNRTHIITATLHALFIAYRLLFRHSSWTKYLLLSLPSLLIELYLERLGRPKYTGSGDGLVLKSAGEDMEAKGVTEYMWDIVYVTWGVLGLVGVAGEWAWWLWAIIPLYATYLAVGTYKGMRNGVMPGMPAVPEGSPSNVGQSNRQKKMEKRGGQKVRHN